MRVGYGGDPDIAFIDISGYSDFTDLIRYGGYRFVLSAASHAMSVHAGERFEIHLTWRNYGLAPWS